MAIETELKLRVDSHEPTRARLRAAGATCGGVRHEVNQMFDTPDGRLRALDCGLRLRAASPIGDGGGTRSVTLTFKGPREESRQNGDPKRRGEYEAPVDDPDGLASLLGLAGLRPTVVYEKRRECWRLGAVAVELDELPKLGLFVEVEGDLYEVLGALDQLDLRHALVADETYVELAITHGIQRADGCVELRF